MRVIEPVSEREGAPRTVPRGLAMAGLATAMCLVILDVSMVNLATPALRADLGLSTTQLSWVVDSYLVAFAGLLLLGGRLADVLGGRKVFLFGLAAYVFAAGASALATTGTFLIAVRVVQGVGAALLTPAALSLVLGLYSSGDERRRALGIWGAVAAAGSLIGVMLGGVVTQSLGWPAVFWLPIPFGIAVAATVWYAVPPSPGRPGRFDLPGAATITLGVSALALGLISAPEVGWGSLRTVLSLVVGVAALGAFIVAERYTAQPLVPLDVFRRGPVVMANAVMLLLGGASVSLFYFLPQYQQNVLGMSPFTTGMSQLPIAVMITLASLAAPWLARVVGQRAAMGSATAVLFAGLLLLAAQGNSTGGFSIVLLGAFLLIGLGLGLGFVYATTTGVTGSGEGETGLLSGLINAARQLGGAVGLAALVAVATAGSGADGGTSYPTAFFGMAVFALFALVLCLLPTTRNQPAAEGNPA